MANNLHIHTPRFSIFAYPLPLLPSIKAVSLEFQTNDLLQEHICAASLSANLQWLKARIFSALDPAFLYVRPTRFAFCRSQ